MCRDSVIFVMMNGTWKKNFKLMRGLRKDNPLSPYLFILMEEVLTRLMKVEFEVGHIGKFYHPRGCPHIFYLLYTNDWLVFTNGEIRSMKNILPLFERYEKWSS